MDMNMNQMKMDDKEVLSDALSSQKFITGNYNTYANECASVPLRDDFLSILQDEHCIQTEIFNEMSTRGFYQTQPADQQQVTQIKQQYANQQL